MIKKYNIGFTSGCFDLFHYGHLNILKEAKKLCNYLIVGVSTDKLIKKYKKRFPVITQEFRIKIIEELKCVNKVVSQKKLVDIRQFKKLKADVFFLGDDWKNNYSNEGINWLRDNKKIVWIKYTKSLSTSKVIEKIIRNSFDLAQSLKRK